MKKLIGIVIVSIMVISLVGCTNDEDAAVENINKGIALHIVVDAIKENYGTMYAPSVVMDEATIQDDIGLATDLYEEVFVETCAVSTEKDMLIGVKVAEGRQEEVVEILTTYRESLVNDAMQYPMQQFKLQASQIIEKEGFVFFVTLGDIPEMIQEKGDEAIFNQAVTMNKIAIEAVNGVLQ